MRDRARESLEAGGRLLLEAAARFADRVDALSGRMAATLAGGGRILTCGNGGSAADAQHVATELAGRFYLERDPLDVMAITVNPSLVTALANDYGYDEVFARQIQAHGRSGDMLLLFTTSGRSPSVIRARDEGRRLGLYTVGFTGERGAEFAGGCDEAFVVPSDDTPRIQEVHIGLGHALCECVEVRLFGGPPTGPETNKAAPD